MIKDLVVNLTLDAARDPAADFALSIAAAFEAQSIGEIVATAMAEVDPGSEYARVANAVIEFHRAHNADWRECLAMLIADFGYDRYSGVCHIIPNAGVLIMAVLYGNGDLPRTAEIATMAGWDTEDQDVADEPTLPLLQTMSLAADWGKHGVTVNCLAPGWFRTSQNKVMYDDTGWVEYLTERIPMNRPGQPDDLDGAVVFLASEASRYMTGQTLLIDGGISTGALRATPRK